MKKILMYGTPVSNNLGGSSMIKCVCMCIRHYLPDAEITFSPQVPEQNKDQAENYCRSLGIKIAPVFRWKYPYTLAGLFIALLYSLLNRIGFGYLINAQKSNNALIREIVKADLVMDIRGISQTDFFSSPISHFNENLVLYVAHLLGKPTVKFTQDMGPFLNLSNRLTAKFFLPKLSLIMIRGIIVKELLNEIGIRNNVIVSHDTAFLLEPSNEPGLPEVETFIEKCKQEKRMIIGVTASRQVDARSRKKGEGPGESEYMRQMLVLLKYIIDTTNAKIFFIPNEFSSKLEGAYDDLFIARELNKALHAPQRCFILEKSIDAPLMKRYISQCDLVISSRYHCIVAALSTYRPTLVIGWGFKYDQLMSIVNQERFLINYKNSTSDKMVETFKNLFDNKEEIFKHLKHTIPIIKSDIYENAKLVLKTF